MKDKFFFEEGSIMSKELSKAIHRRLRGDTPKSSRPPEVGADRSHVPYVPKNGLWDFQF